jgi:uncharacterized protein
VTLAQVYTFVYTAIVDFEWDPRKNRANIRKHGVDFRNAIQAFEKPYLEGADERFDYGEERMTAYGQMRLHVVAVVFVMRAGRRRIVSARKATKAETKAYLEAIYGKGHEEREN